MEFLTYKTYEHCYIEKGYYLVGGREHLLLVSAHEGPVLTITTNVPDVVVPEGYCIVKNYSENEGVVDWLKENNLIEDSYESPYNHINLCIVKFNKKELEKYIKREEEN